MLSLMASGVYICVDEHTQAGENITFSDATLMESDKIKFKFLSIAMPRKT